jgi:hypothetical protein
MQMVWILKKTRGWLLILALVMGAGLNVNAQLPNSAQGTYRWLYSERDGRPSTCDCDYYKEVIVLAADGTFEWMQQRGYLDRQVRSARGNWTQENDSIVLLQTTAKKGSLVEGLQADDGWHLEHDADRFVFDGHSFYHWDRSKVYKRIAR